MHPGEGQHCPLGPEILGELSEGVGSVRVGLGHGVRVKDDPSNLPLLLGYHSGEPLPETIRVGEEQGAVEPHRDYPRSHLQPLVVLDADVRVGCRVPAQAPDRWSYVDRPAQARRCLLAAAQQGLRHILCGHVHEQRLFYRGGAAALIAFEPTPAVPVSVSAHREWVATVGSVGQPRDGDPRAMYALFDVAQHRLTFHRVAYDHRAAAAAVRHAGLPPDFADRLEQGR